MSRRTEIAFVDSVSGGVARILIGSEGIPAELPESCLPDGTTEGDWLRVSLKLLPEMREQKKQQVKTLLEELENNPGFPDSTP